MVEWSRALDVRLSKWCCSVSMVWVQIPSREEQNLTALKFNSNPVWFNFQTHMYIYIYIYINTRFTTNAIYLGTGIQEFEEFVTNMETCNL